MILSPAGWLLRRLDDYFAGWLLVFRRLDGILAPVDRFNDFDPDNNNDCHFLAEEDHLFLKKQKISSEKEKYILYKKEKQVKKVKNDKNLQIKKKKTFSEFSCGVSGHCKIYKSYHK